MIRVESIFRTRNGIPVLRGVSMSAHPSDGVIGIVGPSGAGKTMLLRCMVGLESLDAGAVHVGNDTLTPVSRCDGPEAVAIRRQIGLVFPPTALSGWRSIRDQLCDGPRRVFGLAREFVDERLERWSRVLSIRDQIEKYPLELSTGQLHRVCLARTLMMNPRFILCDEISANLDPILAREIGRVLLTLSEAGIGVMIVSHQLEFIRRHASILHVMNAGEIVESGRPTELLAQPRSATLQALVESAADRT